MREATCDEADRLEEPTHRLRLRSELDKASGLLRVDQDSEPDPLRCVIRSPDGRFSARGFETGTHRGGSNLPPNVRKKPRPEARKGVQWPVAKANYHQIRRQKELARKTRHQEKQQKRQAAKASDPAMADPDATLSVDEPVADTAESAADSPGAGGSTATGATADGPTGS
jgi:hypothetical protein